MMMDLATFEEALDRYGADLSAWPATSRMAAQSLLGSTAAARAAIEDLADVEGFLRTSRQQASGADSVAARATLQRQVRPIPLGARRAGWAAAAAVALFLGLYVGDAASHRDDGGESVIAASFDPLGPVDVD